MVVAVIAVRMVEVEMAVDNVVDDEGRRISQVHGRRSDRREGGGGGRRRCSRCGRREGPPRDHNRGRARGLCRDQRSCEPVYSRRGLCRTHRVDVRLHGPRGGGVGGHHADSRRGRRV